MIKVRTRKLNKAHISSDIARSGQFSKNTRLHNQWQSHHASDALWLASF